MGQKASEQPITSLDPEKLNQLSLVKEFKIKKIETSFYEVGDSALNKVPIPWTVEEFDTLGRTMKTKSGATNNELTQEFTYDSYGRLKIRTTTKLNEGKLLYVSQDTLAYDSIEGGLSIKHSIYKESKTEFFDRSGKTYRIEHFNADGKRYQIDDWYYDDNGRVVEIIANEVVKFSLRYDKLGNIISQKWTSEKERDKTFGFDYLYEGTKLISKKGQSENSNEILFKYKSGLLTEIHHPSSGFTTIQVLKYEYY